MCDHALVNLNGNVVTQLVWSHNPLSIMYKVFLFLVVDDQFFPIVYYAAIN